MRKRSEATKRPDDEAPFISFPLTGERCSVCREPQRQTPGGLSCKNGHGGVDPLENEHIPPIEFPSANAATESKLSPDFARIVETIFVDKPFEVYQQLEKDLRVGENRSDHGTVNKALDNAEPNARLAHRLWVTSVVERKRWELENAVIFAVMRDNATEMLTREKTQGLRPKQITDADVASALAQLYPDEFRSQEIRRTKVEMMEASMKNMAEVWMRRCSSLSTMLSKQR